MSLNNINIAECIDSAKKFISTPTGAVVLTGAVAVATTLATSWLTKKFSPEKATFWRATVSGIANTALVTALGAVAVQGGEAKANRLEENLRRLARVAGIDEMAAILGLFADPVEKKESDAEDKPSYCGVVWDEDGNPHVHFTDKVRADLESIIDKSNKADEEDEEDALR